MATANVSKNINATQDEVWTVLSNPQRFEDWLTLHTKWKSEPPAELSKGSQICEVVTIMGMPNTIEWAVDEYDAPTSMTISGAGMAGAKVTFVLSVQADGDASVATIDAEFISQMMVGAIGGAVERASVKELDESLTQLAALVS
ncbi:MAG: SRPBCC family protein [Nocardioidaceae bacterium]|nr:SRPBCC family protein [Nocardioidaceae bacterium]